MNAKFVKAAAAKSHELRIQHTRDGRLGTPFPSGGKPARQRRSRDENHQGRRCLAERAARGGTHRAMVRRRDGDRQCGAGRHLHRYRSHRHRRHLRRRLVLSESRQGHARTLRAAAARRRSSRAGAARPHAALAKPLLGARRRLHQCDQRHRERAVGYRRAGGRASGLETDRRPRP